MASGVTTTSASTKKRISPLASRAPKFLARAGPCAFGIFNTFAPNSSAIRQESSVSPSATTINSVGGGEALVKAERDFRSLTPPFLSGTITEMVSWGGIDEG